MELDRDFEPEGMLNMYPYGMSTGGEEFITLFHGEEYTVIQPGCEIGFGFSLNPIKAVKSATKFTRNVVKSAGREIGRVSKTAQNAVGAVGKQIKKIPVVGSPLATVFDAPFKMAMAPVNLTMAVVVEGQRIDKAVMSNLKEQLHEFKQVAPYAQMVISVVPGVGQGVSAALSAGLALAEGQSIADVLKAGMIGAIPGGPLVKAAVTMGVETIQAVASGKRLNLQTLSQTASGVASSALGLPVAATTALVAGVGIVGNIAAGKPLDKALTDGAIRALPVSDTVKGAMTEASALSLELAQGKKLDAAMTARITKIAATLPPTNPLSDSIKTGFAAAKKSGADKSGQVLSAALQSGLADSLVSMGAQSLPPDVQKGIKAGVSVGSGAVFQQKRGKAIVRATGKLAESGIQLAKTSPMFNEARKLATTKGATKGFDLGAGLTQQQIGTFDVATIRDRLPADQKIGFDMALAARVGAVNNPKPETLSPAAHAGNAITLGMQGFGVDQKAAIMKTIESNSSATVGATAAIKEVAANRESWLARVLKAFGLRK